MFLPLIILALSACCFSSPIAQQAGDNSSLSEVAKSCCRPMHEGCCVNSMKYNQPLRCDEQDPLVNLRMRRCIEARLHGSGNQTADGPIFVGARLCCDVFDYNCEDEGNHCTKKCMDITETPSFSLPQKMSQIKHCIFGNKLFNCYKECTNTAGFSMEQHCFNDPQLPILNCPGLVPKSTMAPNDE